TELPTPSAVAGVDGVCGGARDVRPSVIDYPHSSARRHPAWSPPHSTTPPSLPPNASSFLGRRKIQFRSRGITRWYFYCVVVSSYSTFASHPRKGDQSRGRRERKRNSTGSPRDLAADAASSPPPPPSRHVSPSVDFTGNLLIRIRLAVWSK
ncbi:hypothetical protein B296_00019859, partial [Ensete ventricosum]